MMKSWLLLFLLLLQTTVSFLSDPGVACTDHSDCTVLGHRYGCLLYRCADFTDHSLVSCTTQEDCCAQEDGGCEEDKYTCVRTYLPPYPEGFCLLSSSLHSCSSQSSCPGTPGLTSCCGEWCCPTEYYSQWRNFSCFSHVQCRAWSTGQYCCPDSTCCHSLPDYQDYYAYDYDTMQYTTDTDTTTEGLYENYQQYHGDTTYGYSYDGDDMNTNSTENENESNKSEIAESDNLSSHDDAFIESETEDVAGLNKNEKYDFFPVKDIFSQNNSTRKKADNELLNKNLGEEVDIVSLQDSSEFDDSDENLDSTLHYEIISNTIEPQEESREQDSADSEKDIDSVGEDNASLENTDEEINFFPSEHVLLTIEAENITENIESEIALEDTSPVTLGSTSIEEDLFDGFANEVSVFTSNYTENETATESSEFETFTIFENTVTVEEGSGLEFPDSAENVFVEQIEDDSSAQTVETLDNINEDFEITTSSGDLSLSVFENSGDVEQDDDEIESDTEQPTNIKSVKVRVNVKSADYVNSENEIVKNKLKFHTPEEFVSDITRQIESGGDGLNVWSKDQDIFDSQNGSGLSELNSFMLFMCSLILLLNFKCSFQK